MNFVTLMQHAAVTVQFGGLRHHQQQSTQSESVCLSFQAPPVLSAVLTLAMAPPPMTSGLDAPPPEATSHSRLD